VACILVVDDDQFVRSLLRAVLERQGYSVVEAANGDEGLQAYQARPTDVVITDMQMPGMDGQEMILALRGAWPTARIIAMSGGKSALNMAKTLVQYTLEKPLCMKVLLDTVQQLVSAPGSAGVKHSSVAAVDDIQVSA
jgi:two-component system response regulator (stage 0 sporulation protein F)